MKAGGRGGRDARGRRRRRGVARGPPGAGGAPLDEVVLLRRDAPHFGAMGRAEDRRAIFLAIFGIDDDTLGKKWFHAACQHHAAHEYSRRSLHVSSIMEVTSHVKGREKFTGIPAFQSR